MIVVDTNVIVYLWIPGDFTELSEKLLLQDPQWAAPLLWRSEFRNVLSGCIRRGMLDLNKAISICEAAESLMSQHEYHVPSPTVLELTDQSSCSGYDCEFVALASELKVKLITMDREILKSFPAVALPMDDFIA